jgi:WD40 repeat protein
MTHHFLFDPQMISCSGDKTIRLWRRSETDVWEEDDQKSQPLSRFRYGVTFASFCPQSRLLATAALDGQITLWNTEVKES